MADRYPSRQVLADKIEWEGGIPEALDYGIRALDMPEGDIELTAAWSELENCHIALRVAAAAVRKLLPEPGEPSEFGDE